jgi:4-hydroxy-2-oxoheptanedioate aldolase
VRNPVNTFKRTISQGGTQIGMWVGLADGYAAELLATVGFDWLLIDGEHAPNDLRGMLAQLQAVAPYGSHPILRPPEGSTALIKQLLDIGAQTLLVPMVESAEQAARVASATRYPPRACAEWAAHSPAPRAGTRSMATCTAPVTKSACWCRWNP